MASLDKRFLSPRKFFQEMINKERNVIPAVPQGGIFTDNTLSLKYRSSLKQLLLNQLLQVLVRS